MPPPALSAHDEENFDLWRDATRAAVGYWGRLGRLAFESVAAFVPLVSEVRRGEAPPAVVPAPPARIPVMRTILVEAEAGQYGLGVFLVENTTTQEVSVPVGATPFLDADGREVSVPVVFRPATVTLDPGDQLAVQVAVAVDETLEPDVRYRAEIGLPGLSEMRIPLVVRRRVEPGGKQRQAKAKTRAA